MQSAARRSSGFLAGAIPFIALLLPAFDAQANPVPDKTAKEFNDLPRQVVEHRDKESAARLRGYFGLYGIDLLSAPTLDYMDRHFDAFKAVMAQSQRPPAVPSYRLNDWYRARAREADRELMIGTLREWLTAPVTEAPHHGSMRTVGPAEAIEAEILATRLDAADLLSDWGDRGAVPAMRGLARKVTRKAPPDERPRSRRRPR